MSQDSTLEEMRAAVLSSQHTQIAAVFDNEQQARDSLAELEEATEISRAQVTLIDPNDAHFSEKLEGDSQKLGKHMWHAHLLLGALGLVIGMLVGWLLVNFGPALTRNNPLFTYIAMISPGIFVGLFIAGLVSLRPDRSEIIDTVRHAIRRKQFAIVVNLKKNQSVKTVSDVLDRKSRKVVEAAS